MTALVAAGAAGLALGPLPGQTTRARAQTATTLHVSMKDFAFMPATPPPIKVGTTVTWSYDESATDPMPNCETVVVSTQCPGHTATAFDKGPNGKPVFDSGTLKKAGASYSFTFTKPGTYRYYCIYHGGDASTGKNNPITNMNGTLVVEGDAATPASAPAPSAQPSPSTRVGTTMRGQSASAPANGGLANTGAPALFGWGLFPLSVGLLVRRRR